MTTEIAIINKESAIIPAAQPSVVGASLNILTMTTEQVERIKLLSQMYAASTFNKSRNPLTQGDFFLIMLKGLELSLSPMSSVDMISIIQGTPVLDAKGILALVKSKGLLEDITMDGDNESYFCIMKRKGESTPHKEVFTIEDAKRLGLAGKDNYIKQPKTMLKWRAVTACARVVFPDVVGGLYTGEEIDPDNVTVSEDGTMKASRHEIPATITRDTQSSTGESGDDKKSDADETPAKWYEDEKNLKKMLGWAREAGMVEKYVEDENLKTKADKDAAKNAADEQALKELLKLANAESWDTFETGKTAWATLTAEHDKQLAELNNRNADKSQTDEAAPDEPEAPADEPASGNGAPETLTDKDREELKKWIVANFAGRDYASVCEELETDFSECSTIGYAKNKILKEAEANCWAVVTNMITHKKQGNKSYILFSSAISEIRYYAGRTELVKMLGDDFPNVDKIKVLPEGESLVLDAQIVVSYEAKGHYNNVTSVVPNEQFIPF